MVTWLQAPYLPQSRPEASKRPDSVPLSFPSTKRMRASTSPPAQVEDRPVDCDGDQVSSPGGRGRVPEGAGQGAPVTPLCPHRLPCTWNPYTSCSVIAKTTALRTWRHSCGPAPLSQPRRRVCAGPVGIGRLGSHSAAQRETRLKVTWEIQ